MPMDRRSRTPHNLQRPMMVFDQRNCVNYNAKNIVKKRRRNDKRTSFLLCAWCVDSQELRWSVGYRPPLLLLLMIELTASKVSHQEVAGKLKIHDNDDQDDVKN